MKNSDTHRNIRRLLSLLLCCLLMTGCLGLGAAADSDEPAVQPDIADVIADGSESSPQPDANEIDALAEPDPEPDREVHITFNFDDLGLVKIPVDYGQCPSEVPSMPEENLCQGYMIIAWLDKNGDIVDPTEIAVTEDTVYSAVMERSVSVLLNTDEHKPYINGCSPELFCPQGNLTRAEAAMLFSNLLRIKDFEYSVDFKDVKSTDWFADAVGRVNALNIATGSATNGFRPHASITRAEFVRMAASCDKMETGECPFSDVADSHWAKPFIVSAYLKGWIHGGTDGMFHPDNKISRAEAVTILNSMLGRQPDPDIKSKAGTRQFCDVFPGHWAYDNIIEASTDHEFTTTEEDNGLRQEHWTDYTRYEPTSKRGWLNLDGVRYYVGADGKCLRGMQTINGVKYRFDSTGAAATGFFKEGGWTRYYKNGALIEDISDLGVVTGPYYIKVYKPANYLIIFAKDSSGQYTIPVRSMLVSCGDPTPTGNYYTPARYRWLEMVGGSWAQWCTQIVGSYLFHSVPNDLRNNYTMWSGEYNNLGTTRSLGCIRLNCEDAKWIYDNCVLGTHVYVSPTETSGPLKKPAGLKIPSWHTWDPTDPTAKYLCNQHGCH